MTQYDYIVVVGPAKHGKSTVAAELAAATGRLVAETGDFLTYQLARLERAHSASEFCGYSVKQWIDYINRNKADYRGQLRALGDIFTEHEGDALIKGALKLNPRATIIVGVRRWCEVHAFLGHKFGQSVLFVEVFRPGRPVEPDSYELTNIRNQLAGWTILNDGDEATLRGKVRELVNSKNGDSNVKV